MSGRGRGSAPHLPPQLRRGTSPHFLRPEGRSHVPLQLPQHPGPAQERLSQQDLAQSHLQRLPPPPQKRKALYLGKKLDWETVVISVLQKMIFPRAAIPAQPGKFVRTDGGDVHYEYKLYFSIELLLYACHGFPLRETNDEALEILEKIRTRCEYFDCNFLQGTDGTLKETKKGLDVLLVSRGGRNKWCPVPVERLGGSRDPPAACSNASSEKLDKCMELMTMAVTNMMAMNMQQTTSNSFFTSVANMKIAENEKRLAAPPSDGSKPESVNQGQEQRKKPQCSECGKPHPVEKHFDLVDGGTAIRSRDRSMEFSVEEIQQGKCDTWVKSVYEGIRRKSEKEAKDKRKDGQNARGRGGEGRGRGGRGGGTGQGGRSIPPQNGQEHQPIPSGPSSAVHPTQWVQSGSQNATPNQTGLQSSSGVKYFRDGELLTQNTDGTRKEKEKEQTESSMDGKKETGETQGNNLEAIPSDLVSLIPDTQTETNTKELPSEKSHAEKANEGISSLEPNEKGEFHYRGKVYLLSALPQVQGDRSKITSTTHKPVVVGQELFAMRKTADPTEDSSDDETSSDDDANPSVGTASGAQCFSLDSAVPVQRGVVKASDLVIGDQIAGARVVALQFVDLEQDVVFLRLSEGHVMKVSSSHPHVLSKKGKLFNQKQFVRESRFLYVKTDEQASIWCEDGEVGVDSKQSWSPTRKGSNFVDMPTELSVPRKEEVENTSESEEDICGGPFIHLQSPVFVTRGGETKKTLAALVQVGDYIGRSQVMGIQTTDENWLFIKCGDLWITPDYPHVGEDDFEEILTGGVRFQADQGTLESEGNFFPLDPRKPWFEETQEGIELPPILKGEPHESWITDGFEEECVHAYGRKLLADESFEKKKIVGRRCDFQYADLNSKFRIPGKGWILPYLFMVLCMEFVACRPLKARVQSVDPCASRVSYNNSLCCISLGLNAPQTAFDLSELELFPTDCCTMPSMYNTTSTTWNPGFPDTLNHLLSMGIGCNDYGCPGASTSFMLGKTQMKVSSTNMQIMFVHVLVTGFFAEITFSEVNYWPSDISILQFTNCTAHAEEVIAPYAVGRDVFNVKGVLRCEWTPHISEFVIDCAKMCEVHLVRPAGRNNDWETVETTCTVTTPQGSIYVVKPNVTSELLHCQNLKWFQFWMVPAINCFPYWSTIRKVGEMSKFILDAVFALVAVFVGALAWFVISKILWIILRAGTITSKILWTAILIFLNPIKILGKKLTETRKVCSASLIVYTGITMLLSVVSVVSGDYVDGRIQRGDTRYNGMTINSFQQVVTVYTPVGFGEGLVILGPVDGRGTMDIAEGSWVRCPNCTGCVASTPLDECFISKITSAGGARLMVKCICGTAMSPYIVMERHSETAIGWVETIFPNGMRTNETVVTKNLVASTQWDYEILAFNPLTPTQCSVTEYLSGKACGVIAAKRFFTNNPPNFQIEWAYPLISPDPDARPDPGNTKVPRQIRLRPDFILSDIPPAFTLPAQLSELTEPFEVQVEWLDQVSKDEPIEKYFLNGYGVSQIKSSNQGLDQIVWPSSWMGYSFPDPENAMAYSGTITIWRDTSPVPSKFYGIDVSIPLANPVVLTCEFIAGAPERILLTNRTETVSWLIPPSSCTYDAGGPLKRAVIKGAEMGRLEHDFHDAATLSQAKAICYQLGMPECDRQEVQICIGSKLNITDIGQLPDLCTHSTLSWTTAPTPKFTAGEVSADYFSQVFAPFQVYFLSAMAVVINRSQITTVKWYDTFTFGWSSSLRNKMAWMLPILILASTGAFQTTLTIVFLILVAVRRVLAKGVAIVHPKQLLDWV